MTGLLFGATYVIIIKSGHADHTQGVETMNIAVCEDNRADADLICGYLQKHFDAHGYTGTIYRFESGEAVLDAFSPGFFDAVFMDVYMGGMTGIETAEKMRSRDETFALVYITISDDHARQAFTLRACAYVSKPIKPDEMELAFAQCQSVFLKNARFIEIISERKNIKIPLVKILYAEVYNREILLHTAEGTMTAILTLDEVERQCGSSFLRCHRSYLINMNHVDRLCEHDFLMKNGDVVPIRQRSRTAIRNAYGDFLTARLFEVN